MVDGTKIDGIYVVHGITGYELREELLENLLNKQYKLDAEFVTESRVPEENEALLQKYFIDDIRNILGKGSAFCTLVHILIYEKIIQNKNRYAIIFENDVCFIGNKFLEKIKLVEKEADTLDEGFIISLENSTLEFPSLWKLKKNKYLYKAKSGRCAGAYMIDRKAAELMLNDIKINKCKDVIDWWHNDLIDRNVLKMYWAHPALTEQGSFNGKLPSSISVRNNGFIRQIRWNAQKMYKTYLLRLFR